MKRKFGKSHLLALTAVASIVAVAVAISVVFWPKPPPEPVAEQFANAWTEGDQALFESLLVEPTAVEETNPFELLAGLAPTATNVSVTLVEEREEGTVAAVEVSIDFDETRSWSWETVVPMVLDDDAGWQMDWSPNAFHPNFAAQHVISKTTTWPSRAPILAADGQELVTVSEEILIGIQPSRMESRDEVKTVLNEHFDVAPETIDRGLDAPGVEPDNFVAIVQVQESEFEEVRDIVFPVPGLVFRKTAGRGGSIPNLEAQVVGSFGEITAERLEELGSPYAVGDVVGLSGLEARYEDQLAGEPSIAVEIVGPDERVSEMVVLSDQVDPKPVQTTIDIATQQAAEQAFANADASGAFVAVDSATGEIRAAVSGPAGEGFNRAFSGAYPPGSTFKVVTATAILGEGRTSDTLVDCPATYDVDGKTFSNFEDSALGQVPFSQAFAESCNTAMIGLAEGLPDGSLMTAAQAFGFGVDYTVGLPVVGGSFPDSTSATDRAAASIGQSTITASPLHMATVAAAAIDGTWRSPILVPGESGEQVTQQIPPSIASELSLMMREVIVNGSGIAANVDDIDVRGKSGTAEYGTGDPLPTHAWFIAEANGLGIAVIVEDGSSGGAVAAPVVAEFLNTM